MRLDVSAINQDVIGANPAAQLSTTTTGSAATGTCVTANDGVISPRNVNQDGSYFIHALEALVRRQLKLPEAGL